MNDIIQHIYETGTVVGQSGQVHELHSAIDRREGQFLFDLIHDDPQVRQTLEVGCAYGLSSLYICWALQGRSGGFHTIIDPFQNTDWDGVGIRNLEQAGFSAFELVEVKSEFALPRLLEQGKSQFDLVFIDGWHTFDHTLVDCFYATRLLRVGGYLVVDDVSFTSIRRVINFVKNYPCYELYDQVSDRAARSWKKVIAKSLMLPIPRKIWARVLKNNLYHRIFEDQTTRMVALQKIAKDRRSWDWHDDAF
jgi:predicted O-methyltransferase YrrM